MSSTGDYNDGNTATGDSLGAGIQYEQPNDNGLLIQKNNLNSKLYTSNNELFFNSQALTGPETVQNSINYDVEGSNPYLIPDISDGQRIEVLQMDDTNTTGNITFSSDSFNFDKNIISPNVDATNKTDIQGKVNKSGDTMTGDLNFSSADLVMSGNNIKMDNSNNATIQYINPVLNIGVSGANHEISFNSPSQAGAIKLTNTRTDINQDLNITNGSAVLFDGEGSISYNDLNNTLSISALDTGGKVEVLGDSQRMTYNGENVLTSNDAVLNTSLILNNGHFLDASNYDNTKQPILSFGANTNQKINIQKDINELEINPDLKINNGFNVVNSFFILGGETLTAGASRLNYKGSDLAFLSDISGGGGSAPESINHTATGQTIPTGNHKYLFSSCVYADKPAHIFLKNTTTLTLRIYDDFTLNTYNDYDLDVSAVNPAYQIQLIADYQTFDMFYVPNSNILIVCVAINNGTDYFVYMNWFGFDDGAYKFYATPTIINASLFGFSPPAIRHLSCEYSHSFTDSAGSSQIVFACFLGSNFATGDIVMKHFYLPFGALSNQRTINEIAGSTDLGINALPSEGGTKNTHITTRPLGGGGFLYCICQERTSLSEFAYRLWYISAARTSDNAIISSSNSLSGTNCYTNLIYTKFCSNDTFQYAQTPSLAIKDISTGATYGKGEALVLMGLMFDVGKPYYIPINISYDMGSITTTAPVRNLVKAFNCNNKKTASDDDYLTTFMPDSVLNDVSQSLVQYIPSLDLFAHLSADNNGTDELPVIQFTRATDGRAYPVKSITGASQFFNNMATYLTPPGGFSDVLQFNVFNDNLYIAQQTTDDTIRSFSITNLKYAF